MRIRVHEKAADLGSLTDRNPFPVGFKKDLKMMNTDKPIEEPPQRSTNYELLYRLYDFILSPEWDALADEGEQSLEETAEATVVPARPV